MQAGDGMNKSTVARKVWASRVNTVVSHVKRRYAFEKEG